MALTIFTTIILSLFWVVIVLVVFRALNLPPILGYLSVGILIGPHAFGLVKDYENILQLADFGVMLLMFTIGLEFSYYRLKEMKFQVFVFGGLQVFLTGAVSTLVCLAFGITPEVAIIIGCILAMSSTTIGVKQLIEQNEINTLHGNDAVAILLFQDIAAIALFILIYSLASAGQTLPQLLLLTMGKSILAILAILFVGHWVVRPFFKIVAGTHSLEIFTLMALFIALSASWLTHYFGLTLSLGGFLAGMILSDTDYRHQLEAVIRPFRDILVGLFFITIGLLIDYQAAFLYWPWVLLLLGGFVLFKILIVTCLLLFKRSLHEALSAALVVAQGGEFGFAMLMLALTLKLMPLLYGQIILDALLISMVISIFLIRYNQQIAKWLSNLVPKRQQTITVKTPAIHFNFRNHVILCGYGRIGQSLARIIKSEDIRYVAVDLDLDLVQKVKEFDQHVVYGDASLYEILLGCNIQEARAVVITFDQLTAIFRIIQQIRMHDWKIPIFVRTVDDSQLDNLKEQGATEVIPASLEISLTLASHLLAALNVPTNRIWQRINEVRRDRYQLFHDVITGIEGSDLQEDLFEKRFITLPEDAYAVGKTLHELRIHQRGIFLGGINREGKEYSHFVEDLPLKKNDRLRIYGRYTDLESVENFLLNGME